MSKGPSCGDPAETPFVPKAPKSLAQAGLENHQLEAIILKYLLNCGVASGNAISRQVRLPFTLVSEFLRQLKDEHLVTHRGASGALGDFEFQLTDKGIAQAKRYAAQSTYFGAAPVPLADYINSVTRQSVAKQRITPARLKGALSDLSVNPFMLSQLGQALSAGRALFLFGDPGNGKTSIAQRLTGAFTSNIWIPRAIQCGGDVIRLYDKIVHTKVPISGLTHSEELDQRWIRIHRPTVVAGGELTMSNLEITANPTIGVLEAPIQMKSNCGTLVIDDFGRQQMSPDKLLNRWIVPLETQFDYLNLPSGKKLQVPFDQLVVFSTNLDPARIVDEAFLRRIPYKVAAQDPTEEEFRDLFKLMSEKYEIEFNAETVDYAIDQHFKKPGRPLRYCHPRDLMLQIKYLCEYHDLPREMSKDNIDIAVVNYFNATTINALCSPQTVERMEQG